MRHLLDQTIQEFGSTKTFHAINSLYDQDLLTLSEAEDMITELNDITNKSFKLV